MKTATRQAWAQWVRFRPQMLCSHRANGSRGAMTALEWIEAIVPEQDKNWFTDEFLERLADATHSTPLQLIAEWPAGITRQQQCDTLNEMLEEIAG